MVECFSNAEGENTHEENSHHQVKDHANLNDQGKTAEAALLFSKALDIFRPLVVGSGLQLFSSGPLAGPLNRLSRITSSLIVPIKSLKRGWTKGTSSSCEFGVEFRVQKQAWW